MANFFVEMLNRTNTELMVQNARGNRTFIENRYEKNLDDLRAAEDSLKAFQKMYGVIALPEQTEASIKGAAEIIGQLAAKEVQAGVLRRTLSADNAAVQGVQIEIEELQRKLNEMNTGVGVAPGGPRVFVPFQKIPELGAEYIRRYRNVEIQYKILQFITPLFEQAKVEENRQTPSVLVLDKAGPAERKSKPKVSLYAVLALVISVVLSFVVVFSLELVAKLKASHPDRFGGIIASLRSDWFGLLPRKRGR
jgi:capsule polysaccharide export protein KpsE/RkpR